MTVNYKQHALSGIDISLCHLPACISAIPPLGFASVAFCLIRYGRTFWGIIYTWSKGETRRAEYTKYTLETKLWRR